MPLYKCYSPAALTQMSYHLSLWDYISKSARQKKLAQLGFAPAAYKLAMDYYFNDKMPEFLMWIKKAARLGYPKAQCQLGRSSKENQTHWLYLAAEQGSSVCQQVWAKKMASNSDDWDHDNPGEARFDQRHLIQSKAQNNDPAAQYQWGLILEYSDHKSGAKWYLLSANSYYPPAMLKLGMLYYNGVFVKEDKWLAAHYFYEAYQYGYKSAATWLNTLKKEGYFFKSLKLSNCLL